MGIETATTIEELNPLWPLGTDGKSEGDDHLRLIKSVLQGDAISRAIFDLRLSVNGTAGPAVYTKPENLAFLEVTIVGGGGAGSRGGVTGAGTASAGAGGGGGGAVIRLYTAAEITATVNYVVGAGGVMNGNGEGQAGGNSTFLGLTAGGGGGGGVLMSATPSNGFGTAERGTAGTATGGHINIRGGLGTQGIANPHGRTGSAWGGDGGGTHFAPDLRQVFTGTLTGSIGLAPGGGGAGGACWQNTPTTPGQGGVGAPGMVMLREFFL